MCDLKEVFKALPHVQTIWVTKDGNFHLHPNNGGEQVDRNSINGKRPDTSLETIKQADTVVQIDEQPAKLQTGRKAYQRHK